MAPSSGPARGFWEEDAVGLGRGGAAGTGSGWSGRLAWRPGARHTLSALAGLALATAVALSAAYQASGAPGPVDADDRGDGGRIAAAALQLRGYPYSWGGSSPEDGFDASGLVWYVYRQAGIAIPRDLSGQLRSGRRVDRNELQPGDVVFFQDTYQAGLSHAGIYVGSRQFINAVDEEHGVAVSSLDRAYWQAHYLGASRPYVTAAPSATATPQAVPGSFVGSDDEAAEHRLALASRGGERAVDSPSGALAARDQDGSAVNQADQGYATQDIGARVAASALQLRGYPYAWSGSSTRTGFDCSGLIYYVYSQVGIEVPRDVPGQFSTGRSVSRDELQPGDIVFFQNTYKPGLSHDGIYIGGGQFVNAVDEEHGVDVSSLDKAYWQDRYLGARRPY